MNTLHRMRRTLLVRAETTQSLARGPKAQTRQFFPPFFELVMFIGYLSHIAVSISSARYLAYRATR